VKYIPAPLPFKELECSDSIKRILFVNPLPFYERIKINPYRRNQNLNTEDLFPNPAKNICACGCNQELTGRRTRWATEKCLEYPYHVYQIISGHTNALSLYLAAYYSWECMMCGTKERKHKTGAGIIQNIKIDHIVPVKFGGGGCWLNNYQLLCHKCHVEKGKKDFELYKPQTILF
jgi:hypothetical protein